MIAHDGAQSGIQLQVSPLGARALFGLPAGELAGLDLPAADLLGRLGAELPEQLHAAGSWDARFRLLDDRLGRLLDPDRAPPPPEVRRAWRVLRASGGTARIADVAREVGWSERHLAARFRTEIGLTPKAAARVIRFDRAPPDGPADARRRSWRRPAATPTRRTWSASSSRSPGSRPRAWLAAEVGNLQDPDDAAGRDWAS